MSELRARALTWADVDPDQHPFELYGNTANELATLVAPLLPTSEVAAHLALLLGALLRTPDRRHRHVHAR
ncbi:hypothetical protein [Streptomyces sp. NPDC088725]|uniref:hypothetical protein n=1 Tax=Streptomyces sp. NPDC088725 TaxID=3365873 RepID=UPI0038116659